MRFRFRKNRVEFRLDSRRLCLPGFALAFSTAFLEGCARRAHGCFPVRAPNERGGPELEGSLLGRGDTEVLFSLVLEVCFAVVAPRRAYCDRPGLSFFFLTEVRSRGVADATAFSRVPCFAGRPRPVRPRRSCRTRWLPSLAALFTGRLHATSRGITPFLVPDRCISR